MSGVFVVVFEYIETEVLAVLATKPEARAWASQWAADRTEELHGMAPRVIGPVPFNIRYCDIVRIDLEGK